MEQMNNAELIKALRQRAEAKESELTFAWLYETQGALSQAADALEAQQARIAELEAQLPKDGEWMKSIRWYYQQPTRSVATTDGTAFMCRSTGKPCQNATEYGYCKQTVCTNCG